VLGLENVWMGHYRRANGVVIEGPSLRTLIEAQAPALADQTTNELAQALYAARAIQPPFDQEILGDDDAPGRQRVRTLIDSLKRVSQDLAKSAYAIGITHLTLAPPKLK
jgi:putative iron-regulated protein